METEIKTQRGGRREGAGRKKMANGRSITVGLKLSPKAYAQLQRMADQADTTKNDILNRHLEALADQAPSE